MLTQSNAEQLLFSCVERRRAMAAFNGRTISSDAGALLLRRTDAAISLIDRLAGCFVDRRDPALEYLTPSKLENAIAVDPSSASRFEFHLC